MREKERERERERERVHAMKRDDERERQKTKKKKKGKGEKKKEGGPNSHSRGTSRRNMAKRKAAYIAGLEEFFSYVAEYTIKNIM